MIVGDPTCSTSDYIIGAMIKPLKNEQLQTDHQSKVTKTKCCSCCLSTFIKKTVVIIIKIERALMQEKVGLIHF